jgi:GTP-binding protein YchF
MNVALLGLPRSGKTTVFDVLTGLAVPVQSHGVPAAGTREKHLGVIHIEDERVDGLSAIFSPKKTTYSEITLIDTPAVEHGDKGPIIDPEQLGALKTAEVFLHVVRAFSNPSVAHPRGTVDPLRDAQLVESELLSTDYLVAEKRLERMVKEHFEGPERNVLEKCREHLEREEPLRLLDLSEQDKAHIAGYSFASQKPMVLLANVDEEKLRGEPDADLADYARSRGMGYTELSAEVEMEIGELEPEDAEEFLREMGISEPARRKFIRVAYETMNLLSFFTVGTNEVRSWTVPAGTTALQAAGHVHTDMARGFIRAEVVPCPDFLETGSFAEARKQHKMHVEGKDYLVQDGDVIYFRFNV